MSAARAAAWAAARAALSAPDAGFHRPPVWPGEYRHPGLDGLQLRLWRHLSLQPLQGQLGQFSLRERPHLRDGRAPEMGPARLEAKKRLWVLGGDRAAWNDIGFPSPLPHADVGHGYQGLGAGHPGLLQHGRPSLHGHLLRPERQDGLLWQGLSTAQTRGPQRAGRDGYALHPNVYVAQTITSNLNHFYRAIQGANEFPGPALVNVYTTCQAGARGRRTTWRRNRPSWRPTAGLFPSSSNAPPQRREAERKAPLPAGQCGRG